MRKTCYRCNIEQEIEEFYKHKMMKDGHLNLCRTCKIKEHSDWRKNNSEKFSETRRKREILKKYGLTVEQYDTILESQDGKCAGCGARGDEHHSNVGNVSSSRPLAVDHCHSTNKVRGLLCHQCNLVVGNSRDSPKTLRALADYLEQN